MILPFLGVPPGTKDWGCRFWLHPTAPGRPRRGLPVPVFTSVHIHCHPHAQRPCVAGAKCYLTDVARRPGSERVRGRRTETLWGDEWPSQPTSQRGNWCQK